MNRRSFLIAAATFAMLPATAARADEDYVTELVDLLKKQGFGDIEVTRTLLGRVRIVGVNSKGTRELICNPRTGEILRDVLTADDGTSQTIASGSKGSSGKSGKSEDDGGNDDKDNGKSDDSGKSGEDDDHGDGEDEDGEDNSGHGNSGSNSGGSDNNSGHGSGDDD